MMSHNTLQFQKHSRPIHTHEIINVAIHHQAQNCSRQEGNHRGHPFPSLHTGSGTEGARLVTRDVHLQMCRNTIQGNHRRLHKPTSPLKRKAIHAAQKSNRDKGMRLKAESISNFHSQGTTSARLHTHKKFRSHLEQVDPMCSPSQLNHSCGNVVDMVVRDLLG